MNSGGSFTAESNLKQRSRLILIVERVSKLSKYTRTLGLISVLFVLGITGCNSKFYEPRQIGRFRPVPAVNVILDSLGVAEETPSVWEGAEEPRPIDVIAHKTDYTLRPGDVVSINIFELLQQGQPFASQYSINETGKISIPEVGVIRAAGLTEEQLEEEIRQILSPTILKDPSVVVSLVGSQQYTYSIWGDGVSSAGRYGIPRYDYRLTDAIATAGGMRQFNVSYVYVSRNLTDEEAMSDSTYGGVEPFESQEFIEPEEEMLEIISPRAQHLPVSSDSSTIASAEMITERELAELALPVGLESAGDGEISLDIDRLLGHSAEPVSRETIEEPMDGDEAGRIEWIFQGGKWVPIQNGSAASEPEVTVDPFKRRLPEHFDWDEIGTGGVQARVIKIPADKLRAGDPRYNVIIKPGDNIHIPVDVTGEYFIYGNTNFQGAVHMQGRPFTLKMAVAAAGGLGPLAWPKKCEVTRRIGEDREETVMVDLDKIASGEQPDFFIKPLDLINVGTHPTSIWRAVLRNSFRATYGFGFIYDRNFLTKDFSYGSVPPTYNPITPWKWDVVKEGYLF